MINSLITYSLPIAAIKSASIVSKITEIHINVHIVPSSPHPKIKYPTLTLHSKSLKPKLKNKNPPKPSQLKPKNTPMDPHFLTDQHVKVNFTFKAVQTTWKGQHIRINRIKSNFYASNIINHWLYSVNQQNKPSARFAYVLDLNLTKK